MLRVTGISLPLSYTDDDLRRVAADRLGVSPHKITSLTLRKRSVDARKKAEVHFTATVDVTVENEDAVLRRCEKSGKVSRVTDAPYVISALAAPPDLPPVVVGSGPAGLFAALTLAQADILRRTMARKDIRSSTLHPSHITFPISVIGFRMEKREKELLLTTMRRRKRQNTSLPMHTDLIL